MDLGSSLKARPVVSARDMLDHFSIRRAVFHDEQQISLDIEIDANDFTSSTTHVIAFLNAVPIAAGRIVPCDGKMSTCEVSLGRIAVLKEYRGSGFGAAIVNRMCEIAAERYPCEDPDGLLISLHAQEHAIAFYERLGFTVLDDSSFIEAGIVHRSMGKRIRILS